MKPYNQNQGFTLMELLIVISLIAVLVVATLALLNPMSQIKKAWDAKRKHDFSTLQKSFDDYYNDKQYYPDSSAVCYTGPTPDLVDPSISSCYLCGNNPLSPPFSPYLSSLPCDPQYSQKKYLYQFENNLSSQPRWYRLCTTLSTETPGAGGYNYAATSPNQNADPLNCATRCPASPNFCIRNSVCNNCSGSCNNPGSCDSPLQIYAITDIDGHCANPCIQ